MILFEGKRFKLGCGGVQASLDPSLSGLTSFDGLKVSRKGDFRRIVTDDVPITLPDGETGYAETAVLVKGRFTSSRTVRGQLLVVISMGCVNWVEWAWSASSTKPGHALKPQRPWPKTPGGDTTPTWGVNEFGSVYGCHLIWCSYNLPPPGALPGSVPNIPLS